MSTEALAGSVPELDAAVARLLDELLRLRAGESLLVYADEMSDRGLVDAVCAGAEGRGLTWERLELGDCRSHEAAATRLHGRIGSGRWDAVVELTGRYYYETRAWADATRNGSRIYSVGGLDVASFLRCVGAVDPAGLQAFGRSLERLFAAARRVHVTTRRGTDLRCEMNPHRLSRLLDKLRGSPRSQVWAPSGQPVGPGEATFLGGQLAFVGRARRSSGRVVVDAYQWPPEELGPLEEPVELDVDAGRVTGIRGGLAAEALTGWFAGRPLPVLHLCLGFNPGARLDRDLCEAERAPGALTLGFGDHPFHTDGVMRDVTLRLDGSDVLRDGRFVHAELAEARDRMGLP